MVDGDDKNIDPFPSSSEADVDVALDLALSDSSHRSGHARASPARFLPKNKGKLKAEPVTDSGPLLSLPPPFAPIKKQVEDHVAVTKADEASQEPASSPHPLPSGAEEVPGEPMEVDDGEDAVVREIDAFFTPAPLDEDSWLYVMQFPIRPSWRPYDLNKICKEVRVKPKQSKIEVVLSIDVDSENYNRDVDEPLRLEKQLHLNPVHAVVQLRPSLDYLNAEKSVQGSAKSVDVISEEPLRPFVRQGKKVSEDSNENTSDAEPWISLQYHPMDGPLAERYHQKMVAEGNNLVQLTMNP